VKQQKKKRELEENNDQGTELLNFDNLDFVFVPKGSHEWRQRGYYLVCVSCDLQHAIFIGENKIMVGTKEDGTPILMDRKKYEKKYSG